jgi:DNA-binding response OmpR family regulator
MRSSPLPAEKPHEPCVGRHQGLIHLALLDILMPGMNDPALRECLLDLLSTSHILYMSGHPREEVRRRGIDADIGNFLPKPFNAGQLLERIRIALAEGT